MRVSVMDVKNNVVSEIEREPDLLRQQRHQDDDRRGERHVAWKPLDDGSDPQRCVLTRYVNQRHDRRAEACCGDQSDCKRGMDDQPGRRPQPAGTSLDLFAQPPPRPAEAVGQVRE